MHPHPSAPSTDTVCYHVSLAGEVDLARKPELRNVTDGFESTTAADAVVDLTDVTFMDSTGVSTLLALYQIATARSGKVTLLNPADPVKLVLTVTGVDSLFDLSDQYAKTHRSAALAQGADLVARDRTAAGWPGQPTRHAVGDIRVAQTGFNRDGARYTHVGAFRLLSDGSIQFASLELTVDGQPVTLPDAGTYDERHAGPRLPAGSSLTDLRRQIEAQQNDDFFGWKSVDPP